MSNEYRIYNQDGLNYLTFQIVDWVDIFTRPVYREIVTGSFSYCRKNKGLRLNAYVIMSNHIHLIASAEQGNLSDIIRDFKKFTSKEMISTMKSPIESRRRWMLDKFRCRKENRIDGNAFNIWGSNDHPIELYSPAVIKQKMNYIHNNPVKARLVEKPEDYLYSSARNYAGLPSVMEIDLLAV